MKHRQGYLIFLLAVWCLSLFSGCQPLSPPLPTPHPANTPSVGYAGPVTLTLGSWRTDDDAEMNRILAVFNQKYPNIRVRYETYGTTDVGVYNPIMDALLRKGDGPDLFYLTSYSFSQKLFKAGYLVSLDDLPGLHENFESTMLAPWSTEHGEHYGVPFIATSHAVYYNQTVFKKLHLQPPTTWEGLLQTAAALKANGYIPFANASGEAWPMAEVVFMNLAPNFLGGINGRQAYLSGQRCFNDTHMVSAFHAVQDLAPFLPENQQLLNYNDSLQLFLQGKAAMWMGGSWDIPYFEEQNPDFEWSVFATPPLAGQPPYITFHLDAGIGLNAASTHQNEARLFLEWISQPEFGGLMANELPGFFPMHKQVPVLNNSHTNTFLKLNENRGQDVRFTWEKISDGSPDAYTLVMNSTIAIVNGQETPIEAANGLQNGLKQWYPPAQNCAH